MEAGPARWGAGCAFVDYNRDGHLDLFVSNYIRFSFEHAPAPGENSIVTGRVFRSIADRVDFPPAGILFIATTATGHSRMSRSSPASQRQRKAMG